MLRLPTSLERRLAQLFPRAKDREDFIVDTLKQALDEAETMPMKEEPAPPAMIGGTLHLFSDGGSRGNPGQAAIAAILEDPVKGEVLREHAERIGIETNNVAEYKALIAGLHLAKEFQPNRLVCHLDSELVVRQLNGEYQVKMPALKPFVEQIQKLVEDLNDVVFVHIPREDNYRADALVNKVLDEAKMKSVPGMHQRPTPQPQSSLFHSSPLQQQSTSSWDQPSPPSPPPSTTGGFHW